MNPVICNYASMNHCNIKLINVGPWFLWLNSTGSGATLLPSTKTLYTCTATCIQDAPDLFLYPVITRGEAPFVKRQF